MHITMRANKSVLRTRMILAWLRTFLPAKARYFGVRIFHYAILGNHLHLLIQVKQRTALTGFLRVISGVIARKAMGAEKGAAKGGHFWEGRPYSRVITWGREFRNVLAYVERNALEGAKKISYVARDRALTLGLKRVIREHLELGNFENLSTQMELSLFSS